MKIQLKRSSVIDGGSAKEPTAAQMEFGELAVNYSTTDPAIFIKDANNNIIRIAGVGATGNKPEDIQGYPDIDDGDGTTLDGRYVMSVGDNMTGNLTLGTNKITLNATDGSATFAGNIQVGGSAYSAAAQGVITGTNGRITACNSGSANVFEGHQLGGSKNIMLSADGSAEFAGTVKQGTLNGGQNTASGSVLLDGGGVYTQFPSSTAASTETVFRGYHGTDQNVTIFAEGSAEFAGKVDATGLRSQTSQAQGVTLNVIRNSSTATDQLATFKSDVGGANSTVAGISCDGSIQIGGTLPSAPNISLNADGGGTFDNLQSTATGTRAGLYLYKDGGSNDYALNISPTTSGADITTRFGYDGSASFAGTIQSGDYTSNNGGVAVNYSGNITIRNDVSSAKPFRLFNGGTNESTDLKVFMKPDGSATFSAGNIVLNPGGAIQSAGGLYSGFNFTDNSYGAYIQSDGSAEFSGKVETIGSAAAFHVGTDKDVNKVPFNIYDTANGNATLARILGDGSAEFDSRVTSNNSFLASNATGGELILSTGSAFGVIKGTATGNGSSGALEFKPANGANTSMHLQQDSLRIGTSAVTDPKIVLGTNGIGTFTGNLNVGGTSSAPNIELSASDGSATFAGQGTFSGDLRVQDGGNFRVRIASNATHDAVLLKNDGSAMFAGNVGIGTSTPADLCHINKAGSGSAYFHSTNDSTGAGAGDGVVMGISGTNTAFIWNYESGPTIFGTANNERMRIDSSGNVGIGTSSPQRALVVSDAGTEGFEFYPGSSSGTNTLNHYNRSTAAFVNINTIADQHIFGRADGEKMRIDSSGRVGIGTSSPSRALTVNGDINLGGSSKIEGGSSTGTLQIQGGSTYPGGNILLGGGSSTDDIRFRTTGAGTTQTERLRIDSSGNVKIAGTIPSAPNIELKADGSAEFDGIVTSGGDPASAANTGVDLRPDGSIVSSGAEAITLYTTGNSNANVVIRNSGSADFNGKVDAGALTVDSNLTPTTGTSIESFYTSNGGVIQSYDRDNLNLEPLQVRGSTWALNFDGSATFDGVITTGVSSPSTGTGTWIQPNGGVYTTRPAGSTDQAFACYQQGNPSATAEINADGSAEFSGNIRNGGNPYQGTANGTLITASGGCLVSVGSGANETFLGYTTGTTNPTFKVTGDGSAEFAGQGTFSGDLRVQDGGNFRVRIASNATHDAVLLKNDGSGTFAGAVISGSLTAGGGGGSYLSTGEVAAYSATSTSYVWRSWDASGSSNVLTSSVKADGSASFSNSSDGVYTFISNKPAANAFCVSGGTNSSATSPNFYIHSNGSANFNGSVTANGTVLTSDQRFKENITPANPQLTDIEVLGAQLKNFDWKADAPGSNSTRQLGLIAQDVEAVCPGIVKTINRTKRGGELTPEIVVPAVYETRTVPAELDEEGEVVKAETTEQVLVTPEQVTPATYEELDDSYKGISHDALIMKLLGAVAELSAEVAALTARIKTD